MPAADLAVADDRAAQALAEEQVGEVVQARVRPAWSRSARAAQFTSLSTTTGPLDQRREDLGRIELAEQERRVGQVDQPPGVPRSTGSAALTTASRGRRRRPSAGRAAGAARSAAATASGRAGRASSGSAPRHGVAVGVDALGRDALRRDADREGRRRVAGQRVVGADPAAAAAAGGPLAGVAPPARPRSAGARSRRRSAWRAGLRGQLGPGQPPVPHQRAQHVLVGQRAQQLQRRPRRGPRIRSI